MGENSSVLGPGEDSGHKIGRGRPRKTTLTQELFERAGRNEITGDAADAEAERFGLGRLSRAPSATEYDPQKERFWTLPMAIAWIAYGNFEAVREQWAEYRGQCLSGSGTDFTRDPADPFARDGFSTSEPHHQW